MTDVDELVDPVTGDWDVEMVKDLFWEEDQQVILAIPVFEGHDNLLARNFDKHGKFSVRSASVGTTSSKAGIAELHKEGVGIKMN